VHPDFALRSGSPIGALPLERVEFGADLGDLWLQARLSPGPESEVATIGADRALAIAVEGSQSAFLPVRGDV
jgi:hypothetical protein